MRGRALRVRARALRVRARRRTLAGQFLGLQLLILLLVLAGVTALSLAQSSASARRTEGRASLAAAESLAATPLVRDLLPEAGPTSGATPAANPALPGAAESVRALSGSSSVVLTRTDGTVLTSSDPATLGTVLPLGDPSVATGRAWTGVSTLAGRTQVVSQVPVLSAGGEQVGVAVVGRELASVWERLQQAVPNLLVYAGVTGALGLVGSVLLSRRVKRQTMGMEPGEITGLVEQREAMLRGLREGVVALDPALRVSVANDSAREVLGWPADCEGRLLAELPADESLRAVLAGESPGADALVLAGERVLICNRRPVRSRGRVVGSVTTLRDRTELTSLEAELGTTRTTSDTLRAHTHEFTNQLHVISGLVQLGEHDEVLRLVHGLTVQRSQVADAVTSRVADPGVAALLIAKTSLATERGVDLHLEPGAALPRLADAASHDLATVVGNLVDNALDAVHGVDDAVVTVGLAAGGPAVEGDVVTVVVRDSGPGVGADDVERVFRQGWSTKPTSEAGGRGFGLALTRLACRRRGGDVTVHDDHGAVFTAVLRCERAPVAAGVDR